MKKKKKVVPRAKRFEFDIDNDRMCRRCMGKGCNYCDGCGEVGRRKKW